MNDNVTHLKAVPPVSSTMDQEGMLQSIANFLREQSILEEWPEDEIELQQAQPDEIALGKLTPIEIQFYSIGQYLQQLIHEELIEVDAANTDKITAVMREKKISMAQAAQEFSQDREKYLDDDTRILLNQCSVTMGNVLTIYEWSVRSRTQQWDKPIIIRKGFEAYAYG